MDCRKCGNVIMEDTSFCPKCGTKVETEDATNIQLQNKKWWIWGIVIIVALIVIISLLGGGNDTNSPTTKTTQANDTNEINNSEELETVLAADLYTWIAENDEFDYIVPEKSISFIENNPQFFPGSDKNTGAMSDHTDYEASYPHIAKNSSKYEDKLISIYGNIVDCEETETDYGTITYLQITDYAGYSYCMYYLGTLEDALEGYSAWANILPFGTIVFENVGATYTEAVIGAACYVDVETYDDMPFGYEEEY